MKKKYTTINFDFLKEHIGSEEAENIAKILGDFLLQEKICTKS